MLKNITEFFSEFLLKWGVKSTRFWNISLNLEFSTVNLKILFSFFLCFFKNIFLLFSTFANDHIYKAVSTLINVVKFDVKNNNFVSTLPNVVNIKVEIDNVDSTLFNVVNSNVNIQNVVFHVVSRRFNVEYTWCVCRDEYNNTIETTLKCLLMKI